MEITLEDEKSILFEIYRDNHKKIVSFKVQKRLLESELKKIETKALLDPKINQGAVRALKQEDAKLAAIIEQLTAQQLILVEMNENLNTNDDDHDPANTKKILQPV